MSPRPLRSHFAVGWLDRRQRRAAAARARAADPEPYSASGLVLGGVIDSRSVLRRAATWRFIGAWVVVFGLATWGLEAVLLQVVPGARPEPWGGVFRFVQAVLWVVPASVAIAVAERWPVESLRRHWRRAAGQLAFGVALGPVWGVSAYWLATLLMPWWRERGMWGVIATEAKGALFGYGTTAVLAHVVLRTLTQRAREVAAADAVRRAADARLQLLKLELQPDALLRAMDAVAELIPQDVGAANDSLVLLAEAVRQTIASSRVHDVSLREELAVTETFVRLHELTRGSRVEFSTQADADALEAAVPHLILQPLVEDALRAGDGGRAGQQPPYISLRISAEAAGGRLAVRVAAAGAEQGAWRQPGAGRGLAHTRERLSQLFGDEHALAVRAADGTGESVLELGLPFRRASEGSAAPSF